MVLQVPVDRAVKVSAQQIANQLGFSSLQDAVRLFLAQLASRTINVSFSQAAPDEILTPAQEKKLTRDYLQARKEINAGKGTTTSSVEEMMRFLRE